MRRLAALLLLCVACHAQEFIPFYPFNPGTGNGLLNNLVAFWKFDEGTSGNAVDASGNGRTLTAAPSVADGGALAVVGSSRTYSASTTNHFTRPSEAAFSFGTNAFTITAWAYFDTGGGTISGDMTIISKTDEPNSLTSWWLELDHGTPDSVRFFYSTDGVWNFANAISFDFPGGVASPAEWYFIAVRWNGTTLHLSLTDIGDSNVATDQTAAFSGPFYNNSTIPLTVGATTESSNIHPMGGNLDEIGIWSAYLSDCQIGKLFTAKAGTFTYGAFDVNACVP